MKRLILLLTIIAALSFSVSASAGPHDGADVKGKAQSASVYVYCTHGSPALYCNVSGTLGNTGQSAGCGGYGCTLYFSQAGSGWGTACASGWGCRSFGFATGQIIRINF